MRVAWAALALLLLLPGLGRRLLPMAAMGTAGTAGDTAAGTAGDTAMGTAGTAGDSAGRGSCGTGSGTNGTGSGPGDSRSGPGDSAGDAAYVPGSVSAAFVTCPNQGVATELARAVVQQRLAACVNIVPGVTSVYTWQGKLEEDSEVLLVIKTRSSRVPALTEFIRSHHPYEVPEVVALPVAQGNLPYLRWVGDAVPP